MLSPTNLTDGQSSLERKKGNRRTICGIRDIILQFECNKTSASALMETKKRNPEKICSSNLVRERIALFNNASAKYGRSLSMNSSIPARSALDKNNNDSTQYLDCDNHGNKKIHYKEQNTDMTKSLSTRRVCARSKSNRNEQKQTDKGCTDFTQNQKKETKKTSRSKSEKIRKSTAHESGKSKSLAKPKKSKSCRNDDAKSKAGTKTELIACYENVTESAAKTYKELSKFLHKINNPKVVDLVKSIDEENEVKRVSKAVQTAPSDEETVKEEQNEEEADALENCEAEGSDFNEVIAKKLISKEDTAQEFFFIHDEEKSCHKQTTEINNIKLEDIENIDEADSNMNFTNVTESQICLDKKEEELDLFEDEYGLKQLNNSSNDYFVEAYNKYGDELIIVDMQVSELIQDEEESVSNKLLYRTVDIGNGISLIISDDENSSDESEEVLGNLCVRDESFKNAISSTYFDENSNPRIEKVSTLNCLQSEAYYDNNEAIYDIPASPGAIKNKIDYVIEELVQTEERYVHDLRKVVEDYLDYLKDEKLLRHRSLIGKQCYLFGNIEDLLAFSEEFLIKLKECGLNYEQVAETFIAYGNYFKLYPNYSKNKPRSDYYYKYFKNLITKRQNELDDRLDLASYLLTPIQRLGKYILLLESIDKELKKYNINSANLGKALSIIKNEMRRGNDYIAVDSIKSCPINLIEQGSFIMREKFTILKPKKFESVVFIFEEIIVFTMVNTKNMDVFDYVTHIRFNDLTIVTFEQEALMFHLINYTKCKHGNRDQHTYVLEAKSSRSKHIFTSEIESRLWKQLNMVKEQVKELQSQEGKRFSTKTLSSNDTLNKKSNDSNTLKRQKQKQQQSKFYI